MEKKNGTHVSVTAARDEKSSNNRKGDGSVAQVIPLDADNALLAELGYKSEFRVR
jgi:hypothetical protein